MIQSKYIRAMLIGATLAFLLTMPIWSSKYIINVGSLICIYVSLAYMWNLLAGYAGMVSLGQQMFMGLGGYTVAVSSMYYGVPVFVGVVLGGFTSVLLAVLISMPIFRMKGVYFAIGTWIIAEVLGICFSQWGYVKYGMGLFIQPAYKLSLSAVYYAALIVCIGSVGFVCVLIKSGPGLALSAIRDNDQASEAVGVDIFRCKFICFLVSAFFTGLAAGVLYLNVIFIQPFEAFGIGWTVKLLFIVIIGGIGTLEGPIIGAVMYVLLEQYLSQYPGYNMIILGVVTIAVIYFAPRGIVGTVQEKFDVHFLPVRSF